MDSSSPFLITGLGASGTRWLAAYLKQVPIWEVYHEDGPPLDDLFRRQGVVSSRERYKVDIAHLSYLRVGVIIRDPRDICEHALNKGTLPRVMDELARDLETLDRILSWKGTKALRFDEITKDPGSVCRWLGLPRPEKAPSRIGHLARVRKLSFAQRDDIDKIGRWFVQKWLLPLPS